MKTPIEMKDGLKCCVTDTANCSCCPYCKAWDCKTRLRLDLINYIELLEEAKAAGKSIDVNLNVSDLVRVIQAFRTRRTEMEEEDE